MEVDHDTNSVSTPASSGANLRRKRKQPDEEEEEEELLTRSGPLTEEPIENEYENLDDEDDEVDDESATKLKKAEYDQILGAQEPSTITQYDNIKITPFNLEEELEEGEFDQAGNFIFNKHKETDEDKNDTWADSVDWAAIERQERAAKQLASRVETRQKDSSPEIVRDKIGCYKQMLRIMKPDETVQKTIRRLGNSVPKRRTLNKNSKFRKPETSGSDESNTVEARQKLDLMIELAHQRLEDGDMDIYQKSYEDLEEAIN